MSHCMYVIRYFWEQTLTVVGVEFLLQLVFSIIDGNHTYLEQSSLTFLLNLYYLLLLVLQLLADHYNMQ